MHAWNVEKGLPCHVSLAEQSSKTLLRWQPAKQQKTTRIGFTYHLISLDAAVLWQHNFREGLAVALRHSR